MLNAILPYGTLIAQDGTESTKYQPMVGDELLKPGFDLMLPYT